MNPRRDILTASLEVLVFLLLAASFLQKIVDPDIWFHLTIGKEIAHSGTIPASEFLVYPNRELPGAFHEWGFGLLFYQAYEFAGFWGISILNAALGALLFWFLYRASVTRLSANPLNLLVLLGIVALAEFRLVYRAEIILYVALAAELLLLERFLITRNWRWLAPVPLLALILTQAHPSVIFMLTVLGAYGFQAVWEARSDREEAFRIVALFGACALITALAATISPYGISQLLLPFYFAGEQRVTRLVIEFMPALQSPLKWSFLLVAGISALVLVLNRHRRISDVLLLLAFGYLAYRHVRNIALFAVIMYLPLIRALDYLSNLFAERWQLVASLRGLVASTALTWAVVLLLFGGCLTARALGPQWGAGTVPGRFPETVVGMIETFRPPGRIFNQYELGGYLGWRLYPDYQVFIDGRHYDVNRALSTHQAIINARPGWNRALDRYEVNIIVIQATITHPVQLVPLVEALAQDHAWGLVGRGERALLFFRKAGVPNFPEQHYQSKSEVWQQVKLEAEAGIAALPDQPLAYLALGEAQAQLGLPEEAASTLRRYLVLSPNDQEAAERLRRLETESSRNRYNR